MVTIISPHPKRVYKFWRPRGKYPYEYINKNFPTLEVIEAGSAHVAEKRTQKNGCLEENGVIEGRI